MRVFKDPKALEDLKKIDAESRRIRTIVQNLLGFSRASPAAFSTLRLPEVIDASLALVQHELKTRKLALTKDYAENLPAVVGDANQLKQVFINLIMNALHAVDGRAGAAIELKARPGAGGKTVEVEVRDNGAGIAAENLNKIFEPFFTTKPVGKGTGLGLYIVLGIIQHHKGTISADSVPGRGAAFKIVLPAQGGA
jgi:signal transduction histidine kinase